MYWCVRVMHLQVKDMAQTNLLGPSLCVSTGGLLLSLSGVPWYCQSLQKAHCYKGLGSDSSALSSFTIPLCQG